MDIPQLIDLTQPEVIDLTCSESPIASSSYDYHSTSHSCPFDSDLDDILDTETPLNWSPPPPPNKATPVSVSVSVNTFVSYSPVYFNYDHPHPYCAQQWEYIQAAHTNLLNYFYTYPACTTPVRASPATTTIRGVKRKLFCE